MSEWCCPKCGEPLDEVRRREQLEAVRKHLACRPTPAPIRYRGVSVDDLTREELMKVLDYSMAQYQRAWDERLGPPLDDALEVVE